MKSAEQTIYGMLTENTGSHFLDSGGIYGRHWEQNQSKGLKDFENAPSVIAEYDGEGNFEYYRISVFHYLVNQLKIDEFCNEFNKINTKADNWDSETRGVSKEGQEYLDRIGTKLRNSFNSYNGESALSQVIQGTYCRIKGRGYILLQIHQGCDVRGGYTDAKLFVINNDVGDIDFDRLAPEDVYGIWTPNNADLQTKPLIENEKVLTTSAGVVQLSNVYDGYSLRDENDNERDFNRNEGKLELWLSEY